MNLNHDFRVGASHHSMKRQWRFPLISTLRQSAEVFVLAMVITSVASAPALSADSDSSGQRAFDGGYPDNIIIETVGTARYPAYNAFLLKIAEDACKAQGKVFARGPVTDEVAQRSIQERTTEYLSGRRYARVVEGESPAKSSDECADVLGPTKAVTVRSPSGLMTATIAADGTKRLQVSKVPPGDTLILQPYLLREAEFKAKKGPWRSRNYLKREKHFGYECGYTSTFFPRSCHLLGMREHVGTGEAIILFWDNGPDVSDCLKAPEEWSRQKGGMRVIMSCSRVGFAKVESVRIGTKMPAGIFDVPDFARDVQPEIKQ